MKPVKRKYQPRTDLYGKHDELSLARILSITSILILPLFSTCSVSQMRGVANIRRVPSFQLPAPQASATYTLPTSIFASAGTLSDVNQILKTALDGSGYVSKSYFHVEDGFAVVTQLEQIEEDGSPKLDARWSSDLRAFYSFTIRDYLRSLFFASPGYYRCIVFLCTSADYSLSANPPTKSEAKAWLYSGLSKLPSAIGRKSIEHDFAVTALIYEFKKNENSSTTEIVIPSPRDGFVHLQKSNLINNLGL